MALNTSVSRWVTGACALALLAVPLMAGSAATAGDSVNTTGFDQPFAGPEEYLPYAPTKSRREAQINRPLGQRKADRLAAAFGFDKDKALSPEQFALLIAGEGRGGGTPLARKAAELIVVSVEYLTNTTANPMYREIDGEKTEIILASYGLIVNDEGLLESPANDTSPLRQINWVLAPEVVCVFPEIDPPSDIPCGYMSEWMRRNDARDTLRELYASAYTAEAVYGSKSQKATEPWELVPNTRPNGSIRTVGMAMAPSIWIANFLLIYAINPALAAQMPAFWTPIPRAVTDAIYATDTGQVPYADFQQYFD